MTDLPIIIVSWNVRELLARCLTSIKAELERSQIAGRVIVVDNASHDGSPDMVRERFPQVELIALDENLGFAKGNTVGLRLVPDSEYALLLNPDTEVQPGAIQTLLAGMQARSDVAVATSRLFYGDGAFQHSAFHFPGLSQLYIDLFPVPGRLYESRLNGRYPRRQYEAGQPFEIDHPLGAVMLLRGDAMRQVGLFDESFALYCEEIDWAARFKEAGWRNLCEPAAKITHHEGRSTSQVKVASFVKLWTARYQLHVKHPRFAPLPLARLIVTQGIKRKMRGIDPEMRAACERIIQVWNPKS
ncbi:MAG: glycosyltransferase family 2 protein [Chloroflexi bacterium]|nr:glycosyltransferase family 2 protein [Chloroflexota bacterium]